jgi:CRISPR/Cas system-associated exonuclease Cas4 (RecB family)
MKIKCSVGKGEMEHTDCLDCALEGGQACGMDFSVLRALYEGSENREGEIHVTDLTSCLRKSYLHKTAPIPEQPHKMLSLLKGNAVHHLLEVHNCVPLGLSETELELNGVKGRLDLAYQAKDGRWRLVDYKTARELYPELVPYGEHEVQVNIYAYMLEQGGGPKVDEMFIQYIGMRGQTECRKCRQPVEWTPDGYQCLLCGKVFEKGHLGAMLVPVRKYAAKEIKEVIEHRRAILADALVKKQLPAAEPGWLCKFCQHVCDVRPQ